MRDMVRKAYVNQRSHAKQRGIDFDITYEEWLQVWNESGQLDKRGRGRGRYVMARYGDTGPYAVGNVKIVPCETNLQEWPRDDAHRAKLSAARMGNQNRKGVPHTDAVKAQISASLTGQKRPGVAAANRRRAVRRIATQEIKL